ncbi:MAG TPA: hypothetical protein VJC06_03905 [Candidatus Paceibacterota bacterium]
MKTKSDEFIHVFREQIIKALSIASVVGKRMIPPFDNFKERPFGIVEDHEFNKGVPEVHTHEEDLWIGLEGEAVFVVGGELVEPSFGRLKDGSDNPREIKGKNIVGGNMMVVGPGDILWIPAGIPHMHIASGTARLLIYKNPKRVV